MRCNCGVGVVLLWCRCGAIADVENVMSGPSAARVKFQSLGKMHPLNIRLRKRAKMLFKVVILAFILQFYTVLLQIGFCLSLHAFG